MFSTSAGPFGDGRQSQLIAHFTTARWIRAADSRTPKRCGWAAGPRSGAGSSLSPTARRQPRGAGSRCDSLQREGGAVRRRGAMPPSRRHPSPRRRRPPSPGPNSASLAHSRPRVAKAEAGGGPPWRAAVGRFLAPIKERERGSWQPSTPLRAAEKQTRTAVRSP